MDWREITDHQAVEIAVLRERLVQARSEARIALWLSGLALGLALIAGLAAA